MSTMANYAVIGAGNGGKAMAAHLALMGCRVNLFNRTSERIAAIKARRGIDLENQDGGPRGFGRLALVTSDMSQALANADLIMVVVPSSAHADIARMAAPHLRDGQIIVLHPGRTLGSIEFQKVLLPPGPVAVYRAAVATGNLDYDYDTGNWYTSGLTFSEGKTRDVVSGSIKWEEDARRELNGRGKYSFNLRWNEEAHRGTLDESAYFQDAADEDLFFAVETGIPTLSGTISYEDSFGAPVDGEQGPVVASKISYHLRAEDVTKPQLLQFLKLWLLIAGPVNDE